MQKDILIVYFGVWWRLLLLLLLLSCSDLNMHIANCLTLFNKVEENVIIEIIIK